VADEALFDAVTALSGSGPAFVYRFVEALAAGGAALGLPEDQALRFATATVEGAAAIASSDPAPPSELAGRVTSKGGTTAAGLSILDQDEALARLIAATLSAAAARSRELAEAAKRG
jgi:pyrroline-5-carboxylate reductase